MNTCKKTTEELLQELEAVKEERNQYRQQRAEISKKICALSTRLMCIKKILYNRKRSPYGGNYYRDCETHKKFGKPVSEFTPEEKREYWKDYRNKNKRK